MRKMCGASAATRWYSKEARGSKVHAPYDTSVIACSLLKRTVSEAKAHPKVFIQVTRDLARTTHKRAVAVASRSDASSAAACRSWCLNVESNSVLVPVFLLQLAAIGSGDGIGGGGVRCVSNPKAGRGFREKRGGEQKSK